MVWKSDQNARSNAADTQIYSQPLSADGLHLLGQPTVIFGPDERWQGHIVEAPQLVLVRGNYFLFYSGGWFNQPGYSIGAARCTGPLGPCTDISLTPLLGSNAQGQGPGEESVFANAAGYWLLYTPFSSTLPRPGPSPERGRQTAAHMLRPMQLSPQCARVLGSLVEKGLTTPQQYPLTLNALQVACNQSSNREPVVDYDETTVDAALHQLKDQRLVRFVLPSHGRSVVRYRHVLDEALGLDARQCAILAVLMLRGAQTTGELRIRTERMARFDRLDEVEHELDLLASREEPLATNVGRRPGQKEERWASPLVATHDASGDDDADRRPDPVPPGEGARAADGTEVGAPRGDRVDGLETELSALRSDVARLRQELHELRASLGG